MSGRRGVSEYCPWILETSNRRKGVGETLNVWLQNASLNENARLLCGNLYHLLRTRAIHIVREPKYSDGAVCQRSRPVSKLQLRAFKLAFSCPNIC